MNCPRLLALVVFLPVLGSAQTQGAPEPATCLSNDSILPEQRTFAMASRCITVWIDSMRSAHEQISGRSRFALGIVGGRTAVDALRAEFERTHASSTGRTLAFTLATSGSSEDIAFLRTLAVKTGRGQAVGTAARATLEMIERPVCADSVGADLLRELARIVLSCPGAPSDTSGRRITTNVRVIPNQNVAFVHIQVSCIRSMRPCGSSWTYRLQNSGRVWRVVEGHSTGAG